MGSPPSNADLRDGWLRLVHDELGQLSESIVSQVWIHLRQELSAQLQELKEMVERLAPPQELGEPGTVERLTVPVPVPRATNLQPPAPAAPAPSLQVAGIHMPLLPGLPNVPSDPTASRDMAAQPSLSIASRLNSKSSATPPAAARSLHGHNSNGSHPWASPRDFGPFSSDPGLDPEASARISTHSACSSEHPWMHRARRPKIPEVDPLKAQLEAARQKAIEKHHHVTHVDSITDATTDDEKGSVTSHTSKAAAAGWRPTRSQLLSCWHAGIGGCVATIVLSAAFDYMTVSAILVNSIVMGVQTDYMARNNLENVPTEFAVLERLFGVAFTLELVMRMYTFGSQFFCMPDWKWNMFDCFIVGAQYIEEAVGWITRSEEKGGSNLDILRLVRVLRLVRIVRLVRVLRMISELRTIVVSMMGCMKSLGWTIVLLALISYILSIYFTQLVTDEIGDGDISASVEWQALKDQFGTLDRSAFHLFQSITGGISWGLLAERLNQQIGTWSGVLFCFYIAFALLAMMNVVTGVFVESALQNAKKDKDVYLLHHVKRLFEDIDVEKKGQVSLEEFEKNLDAPNMQLYFESVDLDVKEAKELFDLIDCDQSGYVDVDEFVTGCFRFRGAAKAIDLASLSYEVRRSNRRLDERLGLIHSLVHTALDPPTESTPISPKGALRNAGDASPFQARVEVDVGFKPNFMLPKLPDC